MSEHAIIITAPLHLPPFGSDSERLAMARLGDELYALITKSNVGEYDGNEFGNGQCKHYMYASDADKLFEIISPILQATNFAKGSKLVKRYGGPQDPKVKQVTIKL